MTCVHHWLVESLPRDKKFHARCKLCDAENTFPQTFDAGRLDPDMWAARAAYKKREAQINNHLRDTLYSGYEAI